MKVELNNTTCLICGKEHSNLRGLSQHVKKHGYTTLNYTIDVILKKDIPKCKCGCGKDVMVRPFKYDEYRSGHNPKCFWQNTLDKDSSEYKGIIEKISNSVSSYLSKNPKIVSDETRSIQSERMKSWINNNPEKFSERIDKMIDTKRKQSEDGTLSKNHWINNWDEAATNEKLIEIGNKISEGKLKSFACGESIVWNKGLTAQQDERVRKTSGKNNYRYSENDRSFKYDRKFRNKELRQKLLLEQDNVCFQCKIDDDRQLCLHHADENKQNNSEDNLIFLCRSCHIRVHNVPILLEQVPMKVFKFKNNINI